MIDWNKPLRWTSAATLPDERIIIRWKGAGGVWLVDVFTTPTDWIENVPEPPRKPRELFQYKTDDYVHPTIYSTAYECQRCNLHRRGRVIRFVEDLEWREP
jgi:hypothetical protein